MVQIYVLGVERVFDPLQTSSPFFNLTTYYCHLLSKLEFYLFAHSTRK